MATVRRFVAGLAFYVELRVPTSVLVPQNPRGFCGTTRGFCSLDRQQTALIALTGAPNAGKSTLVNALTGYKVSAVSQKTNTTFRNTVGYFQEGPVQVILYDTPGIVDRGQFRDQKHGERVESAWGIAGICNASMLVIDAYRQYVRPDPRVVNLLETFQDMVMEKYAENLDDNITGTDAAGEDKAPCLPRTGLVFTKIDKLLAKDVDYRRMTEELHRISGVEDAFCVSGLRGTGIRELRRYLCDLSEPSPWLIDKDSYGGLYASSIVNEVIREKIFRAYYKEIPYAVNIGVDRVDEDEASVRVRATLTVPTESMRTIVVGSKGTAIGSVERAVCRELGRVFGKGVQCVLGVAINR